MIPNFAFLEKYRDYGAIFIRLIIRFHLICGIHFIPGAAALGDYVPAVTGPIIS